MASVPGPVVPRKRLAEELRRLRDEAGLTLESVAAQLMVSTSKLSRLENAQGSPQGRDVRDLIKLYGIEGTTLAELLMRWVRAARKQGWWNDYPQSIVGGLDAHLAYETEAEVERVYTIPVLPVLLQTVDYTRALCGSMEPWRTGDEVEQLIEIRLRRQAALEQRDDLPPLRLIAVTHEASVHQLVGSKEIMHAQLDYLVERSTASNIDLRVLPFAISPPFTSTCMYALLEFGEAMDRDVLHIETHAGFRYIETKETVTQYRKRYEQLYNSALTQEESRALIRAVQAEKFS